MAFCGLGLIDRISCLALVEVLFFKLSICEIVLIINQEMSKSVPLALPSEFLTNIYNFLLENFTLTLRRHLKFNISKSEHLAYTRPSTMLLKPEACKLSLSYPSLLTNAYFHY